MKQAYLITFFLLTVVALSNVMTEKTEAADYFDASVEIMSDGLNYNQPTIRYSGRVNAIAINPINGRQVLVATESGGLFVSNDYGESWRHVDSLPVWNLNDVHFIPSDPRVILVTALADFQNIVVSGSQGEVTTSGGGIWISRDGGGSWDHPALAVPAANEPVGDRSCPPKLSAYGASIDTATGRIFVATDCGVLFSNDDLGISWTRIKLNYGNTDHANLRRFHTIAALEGQGVVVGGRAGVWYSPNNGIDWFAETTGIGYVVDNHAGELLKVRQGRRL